MKLLLLISLLTLLVVGIALFLAARSAETISGDPRIRQPDTSVPRALPGAAKTPKVIPVRTSPHPKQQPTIDNPPKASYLMAIADSSLYESATPSHSHSHHNHDCSSSYDHSSSHDYAGSHDYSCGSSDF